MKEYVKKQMEEYADWLESDNQEMIEDAMVDIIAECYRAFGECDELDGIFKSIGWIDEDGLAIFENWANYRELN